MPFGAHQDLGVDLAAYAMGKRRLGRKARNARRRQENDVEGTDLRRRDLGRALPCLSEEDVAEVSEQLGYVPGNLTRVAARASGLSYVEGSPVAAVELYPLTAPSIARRRKGKEAELEPFPTTYWLTCPHLKEQVSGCGG